MPKASGLGEFREADRFDVMVPTSSRPMEDGRYVDHARLGKHEVWQPSADEKKPGKLVDAPNSFQANVKNSMGALKTRSSFKDESEAEAGLNGPLGGNW